MRYFTSTVLVLAGVLIAGCTQQETLTNTDSEAATTVGTLNESCPIMGGDVTPDGGSVNWNGQTVGFCCEGCIDKWRALSEEEKKMALTEAEDSQENPDA